MNRRIIHPKFLFFKAGLTALLVYMISGYAMAGDQQDTIQSGTAGHQRESNYEDDNEEGDSVPTGVAFNQPWRFMKADDTLFAGVSFRDESWDTLRRGSEVDYSGHRSLVGTFGITWFRTSLEVDSNTAGKALGLYISQVGSAAEVYVDGKRVGEFGKVGVDIKGEKALFNLSSKPVPVVFVKPGNHLLALRVSNFHSQLLTSREKNSVSGFEVRFKDLSNEFEDLLDSGKYFPVIFLFAVFLTLGVVHTIMFIYFRDDRPNLFFGLYCMGISFILFFLYYILSDADYEIYRFMSKAAGYLGPLIVVPLIAFYHSIYYGRMLKIFWIMLACYLAMLLSGWFRWKIENLFLAVLIILIVIEMFRVHIRAVVKGRDGALILGMGVFYLPMAIFFLSGLAIYQSAVNENYVNLNFGKGGAEMLGYSLALAIPLSITLYLSRNFARINRKLLNQVEEIRMLSERSLQQEKEKQQLLGEQNLILETRVEERTRELAAKNEMILDKSREIMENLTYAHRIQAALLPAEAELESLFREVFVLYMPKDIVSGDFYACFQHEGRIILAAADCTGHGVSGALMSMIGSSLMSQLVNVRHLVKPAVILEQLHEEVIRALNQRSGENHDGMDIALCAFDLRNLKLEFAGANRPLWLIRLGEWKSFPADKQPVGGVQTTGNRKFTGHQVELQTDDCLYLFSDGFADQFGGEHGKKLLTRRLREMLVSISDKPMPEQRKFLFNFIKRWQGIHEQLDDILVIGVRI